MGQEPEKRIRKDGISAPGAPPDVPTVTIKPVVKKQMMVNSVDTASEWESDEMQMLKKPNRFQV